MTDTIKMLRVRMEAAATTKRPGPMFRAGHDNEREGWARDRALTLLADRAPEATICPSEIARALAADAGAEVMQDQWRALMPAVHAAIDALLIEGLVRLSWKGKILPKRAGAYRIARNAAGNTRDRSDGPIDG